MANQSPPWLTEVKQDSLKSTMIDYDQTRVKHALLKSPMVRYSVWYMLTQFKVGQISFFCWLMGRTPLTSRFSLAKLS